MFYEAMNEKTKLLWDKSRFLKEEGFYLAGGTALALQIKHRISIDLDFFTNTPIKKTLLSKIEEKFKSTPSVLVNTKNELTMLIEGVKITFLYYPFSLKERLVETNIVPLASVRDIASMKAYAMGRRRSLKDYVDLYNVLSNKFVSLSTIISDSIEKYNEGFNDRLFCEQLISPNDLENEPIIWLGKEIPKPEMCSFFEKEVTTFL